MDRLHDRAQPPRRRLLDPAGLLAAARSGDRGALGRLISVVERGGEPARAVGRLTFAPSAAVRHVVGLTGAPGAGKSSLTDRLIEQARSAGKQVGVLAVDSSSPLSGGALLGDRIRMQRHALDEGVFIRSMATRGHQGGLALAAPEAIRVLAAAGLPLVLVETVGVGQVEVEVATATDTTIVILTPGWGDAVQVSKAGLLEVADVFVVNKADLPGAERARRDLEAMLDLGPAPSGWRPPVLLASATTGEGVEEVWLAVGRHRCWLEQTGELGRRRDRTLMEELAQVLEHRLHQRVIALEGGSRFEEVRRDLLARRLDPYEAADRLLAEGE